MEWGTKVVPINRKVSLNPIPVPTVAAVAAEAKENIWLKGLLTIYIKKLQRCTKIFHLKQHGAFQIAVFLQLASFGSCKLTSILLGKNCGGY